MKVLTITTPDIENGLGYRVTIWVAGCSNHCPGCHNKHTWDYNQGTSILDKRVITKIFEEVNKPHIAGITLSGGDPLSQTEESLTELRTFLLKFKDTFPNKNIWIYTGDLFENDIKNEAKRKVIELCDVMVDGQFKMDLYDPDLAFRGSKNQRIIDIKKTITKNCVPVELTKIE